MGPYAGDRGCSGRGRVADAVSVLIRSRLIVRSAFLVVAAATVVDLAVVFAATAAGVFGAAFAATWEGAGFAAGAVFAATCEALGFTAGAVFAATCDGAGFAGRGATLARTVEVGVCCSLCSIVVVDLD
jgi:hypothetical protein